MINDYEDDDGPKISIICYRISKNIKGLQIETIMHIKGLPQIIDLQHDLCNTKTFDDESKGGYPS